MATTILPVQTTPEYFEQINSDARGDAAGIPWADGLPSPALVNWLNAVAPSITRCGSRVLCVGCGLGDDARELMRRGYDVTAFDCSATAIEWCKRIDPSNARCYQQVDLFQAPLRWKHRFDLIVEINTLQSLSPSLHAAALCAISNLLSMHGHLLVIARCADEPVSIDDGPPWALTQDELTEAAALAGLHPTAPLAAFLDDQDPPVQRVRGLFKRS